MNVYVLLANACQNTFRRIMTLQQCTDTRKTTERYEEREGERERESVQSANLCCVGRCAHAYAWSTDTLEGVQ